MLKRTVAKVVVLLGASACHSDTVSDPVAECKQYESLMASCLHRDSSFASQPSLIPTSGADRERIREICLTNVARLRAACR